MSAKGIIFDIKEMALFDGPGIRTTVFLKGCPMRCEWCHNPEGLSIRPELMVAQNGCIHCGRCKEVCKHPEHCVLCGDCVEACPKHLRRIVGTKYTAQALAKLLEKDEKYLTAQNGGVTFSGGEPTMQGEFLLELADRLPNMHKAIETGGYCSESLFRRVIERFDLIMMDLKIIDNKKHRHYTGVDNFVILRNLEILKTSGKPFVIRIPVIPGVNDDRENYDASMRLLLDAKSLQKVELLPYHKTAGAKYAMVGRTYRPEFDENAEPDLKPEMFREHGIPCSII